MVSDRTVTIIFDVFPKDEQTGYYADISRTVVKGKASRSLKIAKHTKRFSRIAGAGLIGMGVAQAIARQPEAAGEIRGQTFILAILVEGAAILLGLLSLFLG